MNSLIKLSSILLLSTGAFAVHAASQSVVINYTLTVPTACTLSNANKTIPQAIPLDGSAVNETFNVSCNVDYTISAKTKNVPLGGGLNVSFLHNTSAISSPPIPYNVSLSSPLRVVNVNAAGGATVLAGPVITSETYTLTALSPIAASLAPTLKAGDYTDTVTLQIDY